MKRRKFIIQSSLGMLATIPTMNLNEMLDSPYFATEIKISEIYSTSAIKQAILTQSEKRIKDKAILPNILYQDDLVNE